MPPFYYDSLNVIVPNLLESQQTGFQRFLLEGISREMYYFSTKIHHDLPSIGKICVSLNIKTGL